MKKGYSLMIVLAGILWGFDGLLRRALGGIPSTIIVTIEHSIRVLILLPLLPRFIKEYKKLTKKDWLLIFAIALFSGALGSIFYTAALAKVNNISYSVVVLLQQIQPIFTVALAALILKEKITPRYIILAGLRRFNRLFYSWRTFNRSANFCRPCFAYRYFSPFLIPK